MRGAEGVGVIVAEDVAAPLQCVLVQVAGGRASPSARRSAARLLADLRVSG